ncbi:MULTISPECIES: hypothetical protein [unclassified Ruegeria]|uniref:hypothetical protein n=1 Tax=unclassified Ruegeria TaxID=2625375 RepID=UPI00148861DD|nr:MULTISPECIES: hypothetical protein [unclassified Ruegeria]
MTSTAEPRFTSEIFAGRFLGFSPDETIVAWAENMVIAGFQSESLYVLLGEFTPFNSFEINELLAHIRSELGLPEIRNRKEALEIVATAYVRRLVQNKGDSTNTLNVLRQLCADEGQPECLFDFFLLYYAKEELGAEQQQALLAKCASWKHKRCHPRLLPKMANRTSA